MRYSYPFCADGQYTTGASRGTRITSETQIELRTIGSLADVGPGANVTAQMVDGVARTITVR